VELFFDLGAFDALLMPPPLFGEYLEWLAW